MILPSAYAQDRTAPASGGKHSTISIIARDSATGDIGIVVRSGILAAGSIVPWAKAGVGGVATQGAANTQWGEGALGLLAQGFHARETLDSLVHLDPGSAYRQGAILDAAGNAAAYTGPRCEQYAGQYSGTSFSVIGNLLTDESVITVVARTFEASHGDLADRLLAAMDAGERRSGEKGPHRSAAILVVRKEGGYGGLNDRFIDLRVDDDSLPLVALRRLYGIWAQEYLFEARLRSVDALRRDRNFSGAEQEMQRLVGSMNAVLRDHPDDPDVLSQVARTLATNNLDLERALELAKRAIKLAPGKLTHLDTLAECHLALGHFDEAIAIESELVTRDPSNDTFWKQLQKCKDAKAKAGR